jgi:hypothetical protein
MRRRLASVARSVADTEDRVAAVLETMASRGGSMAARRRARARAARDFAKKERSVADDFERGGSPSPAST